MRKYGQYSLGTVIFEDVVTSQRRPMGQKIGIWVGVFLISLFTSLKFAFIKAELLREGIIFLIHLFGRAILLMKKLKIKEIKAT